MSHHLFAKLDDDLVVALVDPGELVRAARVGLRDGHDVVVTINLDRVLLGEVERPVRAAPLHDRFLTGDDLVRRYATSLGLVRDRVTPPASAVSARALRC